MLTETLYIFYFKFSCKPSFIFFYDYMHLIRVFGLLCLRAAQHSQVRTAYCPIILSVVLILDQIFTVARVSLQ